VSVRGAPEKQNVVSTLTQTPLLSSLLTLANTIGNDQFATADLTTLVDPSTTSTQHYGPYASGSSDSGTCGNNWADDTFQRHFTIFNKAGSVVVVEQFKDGTFRTPSIDPPNTNQSPGACTNSPGPIGNGGTVASGITGPLHGYFIIPIPPTSTQTSHDTSCVAGSPNTPCTTTGFIDTHFTPACYISGTGTCPVTTFFFHYTASAQGLIQHDWTNASPDRGGNRGDIRST
jgi:hypothetical protein